MALLIACSALGCGGGDPLEQQRPRPATQPVPATVRLALVADLHGVLEPCGCGGRPSGGLDRIAGTVARWRAEVPGTLVIAAGELFAPPSASAAQAPQAALEHEALLALVRRLEPDAITADETHSLLGSKPFAIGLVRATGTPEGTGATIAKLRARGARAIVATTAALEPLPPWLLDEADVVIALGSPAESSYRAGRALVVDPGEHGESLWRIDLVREGAGVVARAERHALLAGSPVDPEARTLLDQTFARINTLNASSVASRAAKPSARSTPAFVGARTCAACHTSQYLWWRATPHGRAYASLQGRGREIDLDCIACHVTGFGEPLGASIGHLEELTAVGCESCHGPGGRHADDPRDRIARVQRTVPEATCVRCHDPAHSPHFEYASFRERLLAPGHGAQR